VSAIWHAATSSAVIPWHLLTTNPFGPSSVCSPYDPLSVALLQVYSAMMALGLSSCICYLGTQLSVLWGMPSQSITIITGITVTAATLLSKQLAPLAPSAEGLALLMMQVGWREAVFGGRCLAGPMAVCGLFWGGGGSVASPVSG
jgi:hypothetical protein